MILDEEGGGVKLQDRRSEMKRNNGGPAFPVPEQHGQQYAAHPHDGAQWEQEYEPAKVGMSMREYFAAHAPEQIPEWFEIKTPIYKKPLKEDFESLDKWSIAYDEWATINKEARYFFWPWYYAEKMINYSKLQDE